MKVQLCILLLLALSSYVQADLPVHCLKHQITGNWKLELTKAMLVGDGQLTCGHSQPDNAETSWSAFEDGFVSEKELVVELSRQDKVLDKSGHKKGDWTMIYDEGFELNYESLRLFAFSKYERTSASNYESVCGKTLVGWWKNTETNERGCYKGFRTDDSASQTTQNVEQAHVVQPHSISFAQDGVNVKRDSKDHEQIVERLNLVQKSWTAKVPEDFKDFSIEQMNNRAGRRRNIPEAEKSTRFGYAFLQTGADYDRFKHYSREDVSALPKQLNLEQYINDPIQQRDCGSCYAIATMEMLSARTRMKYNDPVFFSAQESLDCNYYNQGCDGGYGFLVSKYYTENLLATDKCYPYKAQDGVCQSNKCEHAAKGYKVGDYKYLGGAYGQSNERLMMQEMLDNGPIVVSFEPGMDFMYYHDGVYHSIDAQDWIKSGLGEPEWEKVDHSVLCYGWGETDDGEKYWNLLNSWGENWGHNGKFKVRRGTDESHIESMGEAADVVQVSAGAHSFAQVSSPKNLLRKNK